MSTTGHRAGVFKKPAKPHKSWKGKRTKGEITADNRGAVRHLIRRFTVNETVQHLFIQDEKVLKTLCVRGTQPIARSPKMLVGIN